LKFEQENLGIFESRTNKLPNACLRSWISEAVKISGKLERKV